MSPSATTTAKFFPRNATKEATTMTGPSEQNKNPRESCERNFDSTTAVMWTAEREVKGGDLEAQSPLGPSYGSLENDHVVEIDRRGSDKAEDYLSGSFTPARLVLSWVMIVTLGMLYFALIAYLAIHSRNRVSEGTGQTYSAFSLSAMEHVHRLRVEMHG